MRLGPSKQGCLKAYRCRHPRMWRFSLSSAFHLSLVHWLHLLLKTGIRGIFTSCLPPTCYQCKYLRQIKGKDSISLLCKPCCPSHVVSVLRIGAGATKLQKCKQGLLRVKQKKGLFCPGWCAVWHERKELL